MADVVSGKVTSADCVLMRSRTWCVSSQGTRSHSFLNFASINVGLPRTSVVEEETLMMGRNIPLALQQMKVSSRTEVPLGVPIRGPNAAASGKEDARVCPLEDRRPRSAFTLQLHIGHLRVLFIWSYSSTEH